MARDKKRLAKQQASARAAKSVPQAISGTKSKNIDLAPAPDSDWYKKNFRWSQRTMDVEFKGDWDWELTAKQAKSILEHLEEMSVKTWDEISKETAGVKGRAKAHPQSLDSIVSTARDRLEELQVEVEELYRIRIGYAERLWGYRSQGCFHILWFDRSHAIYDD